MKSLLCVIDVLSKYTWVIPLKDKKGGTNTKALQKVSDRSDGTQNEMWVDNCIEFYNRSMKS